MRIFYSNGLSLSSHIDSRYRFSSCDKFTIRDVVKCVVPASDYYCDCHSNFVIFGGNKTIAYLDKDGDKDATEIFGDDAYLIIEPVF